LTSRSTGTAKIPSISPEGYISRDFALREKQKLWPNVWQVACREEEIPSPGDYHTYDIADELIILVRARSGAIMAYHNVCPHRGRQLVEGCGKASQFRCRYHVHSRACTKLRPNPVQEMAIINFHQWLDRYLEL
jgi:phenylpropionate dioxygenase-like ring-hydroxylating dioxygenase large terminal subunit